jgi:hypothetical protein
VIVDNEKNVRVIEPQSKALDAFIEHYIRKNGDWRNPTGTRRTIPATMPYVLPWSNENLLIGAWVLDEEATYQSAADVIDAETGIETMTRIVIREPGYKLFQLIAPNIIGAINYELSTVEVFSISRN